MKIAISIPDDLFEAADRMAKSLAVSRSELYRRALHHYLEVQARDQIELRLNQVYTLEPELGALDGVLEAEEGRSLPGDDW